MTTVARHTVRNRWCAAKRRQSSSSVLPHEVLSHFVGAPGVAPIASGYERSLRPSLACFSRPAATICEKGDR